MRLVIADKVPEDTLVLAEKIVTQFGALGEPSYLHYYGKEPDLSLRKQRVDGDLIEGAEVVIFRSDTEFKDGIKGTPKLMARAGIGVDNLNLQYCDGHTITAINTPAAPAEAVPEHVLALTLALAKQIVATRDLTREDSTKWYKSQTKPRLLKDLTLGIVGLGNIGVEVALMFKPLVKGIVAWDPFVKSAIRERVPFVQMINDLGDMMSTVDVTSVHLPKIVGSDGTVGIINESNLARMKTGAYLIDASRGGVVNEIDLLKVLDEGRIFAGIDVYEQEPKGGKLWIPSRLRIHPRVVATDHIASSPESVTRECIHDILGFIVAKSRLPKVSVLAHDKIIIDPADLRRLAEVQRARVVTRSDYLNGSLVPQKLKQIR